MKKQMYIQCRDKKISKNYRIAKLLVQEMKQLCFEIDMTQTEYLEMLIRADLKRRKRIISKDIIIEDWKDIEDMPVKPRIKRIEVSSCQN